MLNFSLEIITTLKKHVGVEEEFVELFLNKTSGRGNVTRRLLTAAGAFFLKSPK